MNSTRNIINDKVSEYLNSFYKGVTEELTDFRLKAEAENVPIILKETESFLNTFLAIIKPTKILEVGTAVGYSASFFAETTEALIYTIEKDEETYNKAKLNIENLGYKDKIFNYVGDGTEVIKSLENEGIRDFDLVFIDAAKSHYKDFLNAALPLCSKNAIIIADNVLFRARVASDEYDEKGRHKTNIRKLREFNEYINDKERFNTTIIAVGDGLSITVLK